MKNNLPDGIWVPVLTPFTKDLEIDYNAYRDIMHYYQKSGVHGLFTACLTSEIPFLNEKEILSLSQKAVEFVDRELPVVGGAFIRETGNIQAFSETIKKVAGTGVDAVVILLSQVVSQGEDEAIMLKRFEAILRETPNIALGLYECPYPYHRIISDNALQLLAESGRFIFLKDTCCNIETIKRRLELIKNTPLKLYNANAATLHNSFLAGGHGYCGVGANYYPEIFVNLWAKKYHKNAANLQKFIETGDKFADLARAYPASAKCAMQFNKIKLNLFCKNTQNQLAIEDQKLIQQLLSDGMRINQGI